MSVITDNAVAAAVEAIDSLANLYVQGWRDLHAARKNGIARVGLTAALPEILLGMARQLERTDSSLCDCDRLSEPPTHPRTNALMDHHCGCTATATAWELIKDTTAHTTHFQQCIHKEEYGT